MATNKIVERPGSPWALWFGWAVLGGIVGVSSAIIYNRVMSPSLPVAHVVHKPVSDVSVTENRFDRVDAALLGWWETLEASQPTESFTVEYQEDGTFVARPVLLSGEATFLGQPLPLAGLTGHFTSRRVGNGLKIQHHLNAGDSSLPVAFVATYGRTASFRVSGKPLDAWIRLGRIDEAPLSDTY
ncbi:MAG: hypothetical protein AB7O62_13435 [Pirellulales bacterium]